MRTDWIKDVIIAIISIIVFGFLLLLLPMALPGAFGYIAAFIAFVLILMIMSLTVIKKQVGIKYIKKPRVAKNKQ